MAATTTLTNIETITYGGKAFLAYQNSDFIGTAGMIFFGAKPTESINVPVVDADDAINLADGTDHTLAGDASMTGFNVPVDAPIKGKNVVPKDKVDVRPDLQMLTRFATAHGTRVGLGKTIRVINYLSGEAVAATNTLDADFDGSTTLGTLVLEKIRELAAAWDQAGIPPMGRQIMLESNLFYSIPGVREAFGVEFGGQASAQTVNVKFTINYLNFMISNGPVAFGTDFTNASFDGLNLPNGAGNDQRIDLTKIKGLAWHTDSWSLRHQTQLISTAGWVEHLQGWLLMARLHLGMKTVQLGGIFVFQQVP